MRKGLILLVTVILIVVLVFIAVKGFEQGNVKILSYAIIGEESEKLEKHIEEYETKNMNDIKIKQGELDGKIQEFEDVKSKYLKAMAEREENLALMGRGNVTDINFLLVKVGNYATEHKINLLFDVTKNISDANAEDYVLTDLNFKAEGIYFEVAKFIDKLEKDERLSFEIRDFKMENGGASKLVEEGIEYNKVTPTEINPKEGTAYYNIVTATFKVCGIPVKRSTLIETVESEDNTNTTNTTSTTDTTNTTN